jgi:cytochrome c
MIDTMTLTKTVGAICGSLLVLLLAGWAGSGLYSTAGGHGGHGEEHAQAYYIDTGEDDGAVEEEVEEVDFATLLANADVADGAKLWRKCQACHKLEEGANAVGPSLYEIVGRPVEAVSSFNGYSGALSEVVDVWTPENLDGYLADPKGFAPGNKMSFAGFKKPEERANIIAFLENPEG